VGLAGIDQALWLEQGGAFVRIEYRRRSLRRFHCISVAMVVAGAITPSALAQAPPTLDGETWRVYSDSELGVGGNITRTSRTCDPNGDASLSIVATGTAVGPYPGTFREEYTVTLGPPFAPLGDNRNATAIDATFTIDSPVGQVEGTKTYDPSTPHTGSCDNAPGYFTAGGGITSYEATITAPDGCTYVDRGQAGADVTDAPAPTGLTFGEAFFSAGPSPTPVGSCGGGGGDDDDDDDDDDGKGDG
jgi:hypothetical protein